MRDKIDKLKEFVKQLIGWNPPTALDPEAALERTAVENFLRRLTVYREDVAQRHQC